MSEEVLKSNGLVEYMTSKELENQKEIDFLKMKTDIEVLKEQIKEIEIGLHYHYRMLSTAIKIIETETNVDFWEVYKFSELMPYKADQEQQ